MRSGVFFIVVFFFQIIDSNNMKVIELDDGISISIICFLELSNGFRSYIRSVCSEENYAGMDRCTND